MTAAFLVLLFLGQDDGDDLGRVASAPVADRVEIRYFGGMKAVDAVIAKFKDASDPWIESQTGTASFRFDGPYSDLTRIEKAGAESGVPVHVVSHARIVFVLNPRKGADLAKLREEAGGLPGVKRLGVRRFRAELFADLYSFRIRAFLAAARRHGFDADCRSHDQVELRLEKEFPSAISLDFRANPEIPLVIDEIGGFFVMTKGRMSDAFYRKTCEKAGARIREIRRPETP
ncbi:MAG: hypothetical protein HYY17_08625 [Planctomycetes bacterium]|nr:hypothetical protein [Planctomycetota bacterium]